MFEGGGEKPKFPFSEDTKKRFRGFESRSDDPGKFYSPEEKEKLQKETKNNPEACKEWERNKNSKYRINSLSAPLMSSELFLTSPEADDISEEIKESLLNKIKSLEKKIDEIRGKRITKELVDEVEELIKEVSKYLK